MEGNVDGRSEEEKHLKEYWRAAFQVIWRILIAINRVLNANVLAQRLSCEEESGDNE